MKSLRLNSFKDRESALLRKKKGLSRELESYWNRKIPIKARQTIAWSVLAHLASDLAHDLDPALRSAILSLSKERDVLGLLEMGAVEGVPQKHGTPRSYFAAATVFNLLKKFTWVDDRVDPLAKALERFYEAERLCKLTNKRLSHYRKFDFCQRPLPIGMDVHQIFHLARRKIQSWIGCCEFEGDLTAIKFGPGGVVGLKRPYTTPYYKFCVSDYTVGTGAYFLALRSIAKSDAWVRSLILDQGLADWEHDIRCVPFDTKVRIIDQRLKIANYNEVTFVPKDATTHRAIAIEPHINVSLQLAVGNHFRECLKLAGCNLRDQTRNQELAKIGSIQQEADDPVTLDLRMASDTLSFELVRELLPGDWFDYLCKIRSVEGRYKNETIKWEKFSSMGNGFTFELESMIFYALAQSVSDHLGVTEKFADTFGARYKYAYVSVYGDDLIVPYEMSEHFIRILRFCGFQTNQSKSFVTGPFRESCGKDYYSGVLVRPYYLRRGLSHIKDLIHLLNNLKGLAEDFSVDLSVTLSFVEQLLPSSILTHLRGPHRTTGDQYIWCKPDECHRSFFVVWDTDMQTWTYPIIRPKLDLERGKLNWRYCQFLYGNTSGKDPSRDIGLPGISESEDESNDRFLRDQFALHVSGGGSSGDVVLSGTNSEGRLHLATF